MRITGGRLAGRRVVIPPGEIRPAMDRMRESVFAVLGAIEGRSFLDLFSGSGIIALEAASRGAAPVEAVERDRRKAKTLIENAALAAPVRVGCRFVACELYVRRARRPFDLIFCDPPFPYAYKSALIRDIAASVLMRPGSRLMLHRPAEERIDLPDSLRPAGSRVYGRSVVDFFERAGA